MQQRDGETIVFVLTDEVVGVGGDVKRMSPYLNLPRDVKSVFLFGIQAGDEIYKGTSPYVNISK